ncbi:hypothetical protein N7465_000057 [Penicillium sp. CMV-2018d]|nr:hypothetical protein N7465_000057 [Penicillium sp. CMV-2018d]
MSDLTTDKWIQSEEEHMDGDWRTVKLIKCLKLNQGINSVIGVVSTASSLEPAVSEYMASGDDFGFWNSRDRSGCPRCSPTTRARGSVAVSSTGFGTYLGSLGRLKSRVEMKQALSSSMNLQEVGSDR